MLVCGGLLVRAVAPMPASDTNSSGAAPQMIGVCCMLVASLGYSFLGVSYDLLVRSEGVQPSHSEVMVHVAKIGTLTANYIRVAQCSVAMESAFIMAVHHAGLVTALA